jgi:hypothetical protein
MIFYGHDCPGNRGMNRRRNKRLGLAYFLPLLYCVPYLDKRLTDRAGMLQKWNNDPGGEWHEFDRCVVCLMFILGRMDTPLKRTKK